MSRRVFIVLRTVREEIAFAFRGLGFCNRLYILKLARDINHQGPSRCDRKIPSSLNGGAATGISGSVGRAGPMMDTGIDLA